MKPWKSPKREPGEFPSRPLQWGHGDEAVEEQEVWRGVQGA